MNMEKMDKMAGRFLKGFAVAAVVGGASFGMLVWGCVQIYGMTARYGYERDHYAD